VCISIGVLLPLISTQAIAPLLAAQESRGARAARVYQSACAACHGPDGRGAPSSRGVLPVPPPDFTECAFATREPDGDWTGIVAEGGPARAFDRFMPAYGDALTPEEMQLALDHVRAFCSDDAWPRGELNLPRPLVTEKAYPEDEAVWSAAITTEGSAAVTNKLVYERRFGARNQVEIVLPVAAHDAGPAGWQGGFGDLAVGVKRALYHSHARGTILSLTGEVVLPTGDRARGLGKGVTVIEPFVTIGQLLPRENFIQFQGGIEFPTDTARAGREVFWRTTVGHSFTAGEWGRTWSPMVEVLGARELHAGEAAQWDLVPQVQVTLSTRQHIMLNAGLRVPLTDRGPRPTQALVYVLWDWFDGGLFEGW
jgi:hypothetical protein